MRGAERNNLNRREIMVLAAAAATSALVGYGEDGAATEAVSPLTLVNGNIRALSQTRLVVRDGAVIRGG